MTWSRWFSENRPGIVLTVLVCGSLVSLGTGVEATIIGRAVRQVVSLTSYPFLASRDFVVDTSAYTTDFLFRYREMQAVHSEQREEIARLRRAAAERGELRLQNARLRELLGFAARHPEFDQTAAEVIRSFRGMLEIDRGSIHGLEPGLAVIAEDGVAGIVTEVTALTSFVATLHHPDCRIGAMLSRNRLRAYDGVVHASSTLDVICTMQYIDIKHDVRNGDLVVTSPESVFPSGWPIGHVSLIHDTGSLWKEAEITPLVDPYALDEVFVVRRSVPPVTDFTGEPPLLAASPDGRYAELPLQEQYAP